MLWHTWKTLDPYCYALPLCVLTSRSCFSCNLAITSQQIAQEDFALAPDYDGISAGGGGASNREAQNSSYTACISGFKQPSWQTVTISGKPARDSARTFPSWHRPIFPGTFSARSFQNWVTRAMAAVVLAA
jgi:hypothetical protein